MLTSNFGGNAQSIGYYTAFFGAWMASFQALANDTSVATREAFAINQAVTAMLSSGQLDSQTSSIGEFSSLQLNGYKLESAQ